MTIGDRLRGSTHGGAFGYGVAAAAVGLVLWIVGVIVEPRRAAAAYLVAYAAVLSAALGALSLVMIGRLTNAVWFVAVRRAAERIAWLLPLLAALAVPVLLAVGVLYPWAWPAARLDPALAANVATKRAWLNVPFFVVRAAVYLAAWLVMEEAMRRASLRMDASADAGGDVAADARRLTRWSAGGLPLLALTQSFASFDWLMSLSPAWTSTIYGVYWWAGGVVAAIAGTAILARRAAAGPLGDVLEPAHFHALGKLLLTFVMLWAYFGFSQLLVIWIANVPSEAVWYAVRASGGWGALGGVLLGAHFALPFLALLLRLVKRHATLLAALCWWLLAAHYVDTYWLVMPEITPGALAPSWVDLAAVLLVGGGAVAFDAWRSRGVPAASRGDPDFAASIAEAVA